jgi:SAM-dependent methyltransferase
MASPIDDKHIDEHDWLSAEYVQQWIDSDITRDSERRPILRQMLEIAPFARDAAIRVLDVGAGYGIISEEVLNVFPNAELSLQDYSLPMLEQAQKRLVNRKNTISYVFADLSAPGWSAAFPLPFDLVVSGLVIHNLEREPVIRSCYRAIRGLLRPGGMFLDYDLVALMGGAETQMKWLQESGFAKTRCTWEQKPIAIIAAWVDSV